MDDESLGRDTGLPVVDYPGLHSCFHCLTKIRARHHNERIAAAKFQHTFFYLFTRGLGHTAARAYAAGKCDRHNATIGNNLVYAVWPDQQCLKSAFRKTRAPKNIFNSESAPRRVGSMLQQAGIACHERGRGKAKYLPERKVPRHHRQHRAERLVTPKTALAVC